MNTFKCKVEIEVEVEAFDDDDVEDILDDYFGPGDGQISIVNMKVVNIEPN